MRGVGENGEVLDKATINVAKTKERTELGFRRGWLCIFERFHVRFIDEEFTWLDEMSEVFDLVAEETAFRNLERDVRFGKLGEDFVDMTDVVFYGFREDDDVVYVDDATFPFEFR